MFGGCLRLKSTIETTAGSNRLTIIDEVTNLAGVPGELELLYHINVGRPFLEQGARFMAPTISVAPRDRAAADGIDSYLTYAAPVAGYAEQVYFFDLAADRQGRTQTLLCNARGDKGLALNFAKRELPYFILWKNTQAEADGYVTGLEPATNFPNVKRFEREQGRVISLPPGGRHRAQLEITVHNAAEEVLKAEREISELQKGHEPKVHPAPWGKWSPG
jgi:hypothetical protein